MDKMHVIIIVEEGRVEKAFASGNITVDVIDKDDAVTDPERADELNEELSELSDALDAGELKRIY